jgi:hypothetical protein
MGTNGGQIFVRSHGARDLLQNAALFKTDKLVVWEYVSNGLQYVDTGTSPVVKVLLDSKKKRISIADNGRGMDWSGLQNFFVMHGENIDRKEGRPGRGRFGTGKSAAFGIADLLRITTARRGKRSTVQLSRSEIEQMNSDEPIPVRIVEASAGTQAANGTLIEIEGIHLRSLDQPGVIHYIERHLARWPKNATVFVNNHECEYAEPPVAFERRVRPEGPLQQKLGEVELIIRVSKGPLEEDLRGISLYSNGVWHETTLAGSEGREMSQHIFGELDVPRLDEDTSPIGPFDLSRSMRLNPNNELVQAIYAFVGQNVEVVRRGLVEEDKKRKLTEEARKLSEEAAKIAQVINDDFENFRQRVAKAKAKQTGGNDLYRSRQIGGEEDDALRLGSEIPAAVVFETGGQGATGDQGRGGGAPRELGPQVEPSADGEKKGRPAGGRGDRPKPRGGFQVEFRHLGSDEFRAHYHREQRTIYINLDHPQLSAARALPETEDPAFRRLAYEVAFSEYSIALAYELAARDEYADVTDPIVDIRETLNRVARKAAGLYSP